MILYMYIIIIMVGVVSFPAPSGPPTNVTVDALSSSSIFITWSPPDQAEQNGIIKHYIVNVTELQYGDSIEYYSVVEQELTVTSLHPHYDYHCLVAAVTVESGPYSTPYLVTTLQDGKHMYPLYI